MQNESRRRLWLQIILLAVALELLTLVLRFGLKLESTRDTASTIGRLTLGVRIHHGYCGAVVVLVAWSLSQTPSPSIAYSVRCGLGSAHQRRRASFSGAVANYGKSAV